MYSSPAIGPDGTIYICSGDTLNSFTPDGWLNWWDKANGSIVSSPAIGADGTIYVGDQAGYLWATGPDGGGLWYFQANTDISSSPAIGADGTLYFGSKDSNLYAIGTEVNTVPVASLAVNPTSVLGGSASTGTVTLASAASIGGDVVALQSGDPSVIVPPFVIVSGGALTASFTVSTKSVSSNISVVITATSGGVNATALLTVQTAGITSVSLNPSSIVSGLTATGSVTLNAPAGPSGDVVSLTSSNTGYATVPSTVTVPAGTKTATFTVNGLVVLSQQPVSIRADYNGSSGTATLTVNPANLVSISLSPSTFVGGNTPFGGTVTLASAAPSGGAVVNLSASSANISIPASVTVAAGATTATFGVTTTGVNATTPITLTAKYGLTTKSFVVTLLPASAYTLVVSPTSVTGGSPTTVTATVGLNGQAGPAGTVVTLVSSNTSIVTVPATVTVAGGATKATFTVTTFSVSTVQNVSITASANGRSVTSSITVNPPALSKVGISTALIVGGNKPAGGTVTLSAPAPAGGLVVSLSSSNSCVTVQSSATVLAGATTAAFSVSTSGVDANTSVTVTGSLGGASKTCTLTIAPAALLGLSLTPNAVVGGSSVGVVGKVALNGQAGPSGTTVGLASNNTSAATVPSTIVVAAGSTSATFGVTTYGVASSTSLAVSATLGAATLNTTLTVDPDGLSSVSVLPTTIVGGNTPLSAIVVLSSSAPSGGIVVSLSSSSGCVQVPTSVTVTAGATNASFPITTSGVDTSTSVTVTASFNGIARTCTLTVLPAWVMTTSLAPSTVLGGTSDSIGTVLLNGQAGPSGLVVNLASSKPTVASVPASITVGLGNTKGTFSVTTHAVATVQTVTLTASVGGKTASAVLTVNPASFSTISVTPTSLVGGNYPVGKVTLTSPAPDGGAVVTLGTDSSYASVPATVTVPAGATSANFTVATLGVDSNKTISISGVLGATSKSCSLALMPAWPLSLIVNPSSVQGGSLTTVSGRINLIGRAGPSGTIVSLTSSNPSVATVPASVTVLANGLNAAFTIATSAVSSTQMVTLTATAAGKSVTTTLTVTP